MTDYAAEVEVACEAVRLASRASRAVQRSLRRPAIEMEKPDRSPVTIADFASQALVCRRLGSAFPDDPVVGEESAGELRQASGTTYLEGVVREVRALVPAEVEDVLGWIDHGAAEAEGVRYWTLDPVDGTKGFLRGEQYAVALALLVGGEVVVGVLGCPNLPAAPGGPEGSLLWAVRGRGAFAAPLFDDGPTTRLHVSRVADLADLRLCESVESAHSAHDETAEVVKRLGIRGRPVRIDSQAKYAVVARGEAEVYLRLPTCKDYRENIWDHAAGALVVTEAGGVVTDVRGRPLAFGHGKTLATNCGVVATHGPHHPQIVATLADLGVA